MLRKAFIGAALAFLCLLPVSSDDVRIITLEEAIRSAAEHNLDIEYAKTELSSTLRIQDNVMSTFMPEISLRASVSPTVNFPTSSGTAISYDGLTVSAGADVSFPFTGGMLNDGRDRSIAREEASLGFRSAYLSVEEDVVDAYWDLAGAAAGLIIIRLSLKAKTRTIMDDAKKEAESIKRNKILEVKEKCIQMKADMEQQITARYAKLQSAESRAQQREVQINQQQQEIQRKKSELDAMRVNLDAQLEVVDKKKLELDKIYKSEVEKLEKIAGISAEEAKERLVETLKDEAKSQAASYINDIMDEAKLTANKEAKRIVIQTIQRVATETTIENAVTVFHIDSDEIKGRIIGREGRNIRALEAATGVEIIVDDTPEAIVLSGFDPVRREIARLALHQLVTDGRIHPARIEEVVAKVKKQIEDEIIETGKRTAIDLGIHGLHPELIRLVGKMKYRSSYGQNLLQHSRETANLCAIMASELGLNPKKAKRAGLLHDIGKVPDDEPELPHALLGMKLLEKYKENPEICNAVGAHHDETEMTSLLAPIVQVCDAISGARPGARREIVEAYIKRLNDLEQLALSYPGVNKTYAIQAGRELRVVVGADKVNDIETESLSTEIAKRIQDEMTYPGQVKITVIRETRAVSYAK